QPTVLGHTARRLDPPCPVCSCTEPSCTVPSDVTFFSGSLCGEASAEAGTSFAPPPGWDGACVPLGSVEQERIRSIAVGSISEPCTPVVVDEPPVPDEASQKEVAIACRTYSPSGFC